VPEKTGKKNGGQFKKGFDPRRGHGLPGRSGRKPGDFIDWCQKVADDPQAREVYEARNRAGDIKVLDLAASYAYGKPSQQVQHSGAVEVHVRYDE
jgi:hypothetical protein